MKENMKKVMKASVALSMALTVTPTNLYAEEQNIVDETTDATTLPPEEQQNTTEIVEGDPNTTPSTEDTNTVPSETPQQDGLTEDTTTVPNETTPLEGDGSTPQDNSQQEQPINDVITTSVEDGIVTNESELLEAINANVPVITLTNDIVLRKTLELKAPKTFTIEGNNHSISYGEKTFKVSAGSNVTLKDVSIISTGYFVSALDVVQGTVTFEGDVNLQTNLSSALVINGNYDTSANIVVNGNLNINSSIDMSGNNAILTFGSNSTIKAKKFNPKGGKIINNSLNVELTEILSSTYNVVIEDVNAKFVAKVKGAKFETLQEAIDNATDNSTITVLKDLNMSATIKIDNTIGFSNLTIDFNGYSFLPSENIYGALFDIDDVNVTLTSSKQMSKIEANTLMNLVNASNSNLSINNVNIKRTRMDSESVIALTSNSSLSIKESTIEGQVPLYVGNVDNSDHQQKINLEGVTLIQSGGDQFTAALTISDDAQVNLNNVTINAEQNALKIAGEESEIVMSDCNFTATNIIRNVGGNDVVNNKVTIQGGTYTGNLLYDDVVGQLTITGGTFTTTDDTSKDLIEEHLSDGLQLDENGNVTVDPEGRPFEITGGTEGVDYTYKDGVVTFIKDGNYQVIGDKNQTDNRINVSDNFNGEITIKDIHIVSPAHSACISISGTANVTLILDGENVLQSNNDPAAIQFMNVTSGSLTIDSINNGSLKASASNGAAIGSTGCGDAWTEGEVKNITIKSGIFDLSSDGGNAIGKGKWNNNYSLITIEGGVITSNKPLGGTDDSKIIMTGGYVQTSVIGNVEMSGGCISGDISGTVTGNDGQTLTKVEINHGLENVDELYINGQDQKVNNIINGKSIFVYLPEGKSSIKVVDTNDVVREFLIDFIDGQPTVSVDAVAQIGNVQYKTLDAAIQAVNDDNREIVLLDNVKLNSILEIKKDIILNLGGHTISRDASVLDIYSKVTIKNGNVTMDGSPGVKSAIWLNDDADVVIEEDVTVSSINTANDEGSYTISYHDSCNGASLVFKGKIEGEGGISVNGKIINENNVLTIEDGVEIDTEYAGLYLAGYAKTDVKEATIKGNTGIEIRAGELTVNEGAIIEGKSSPTTVKPNENGFTTDGAGIAVAQHTEKQPIKVNIIGGTISGYTPFYESNPQSDITPDNITLNITGGKFNVIKGGTDAIYSQNYIDFISGGTFDKSLDEKYLKEGFKLNETSEGTFEVEVDTSPRGDITRVYIGKDSDGNSRIFANLSKVYFNTSLEIQLFNDKDELATATLNNDKDINPGYWKELTSSFMLTGKDDYWQQSDWTPTHDQVPTMVKLIIDGKEVASVDEIYTGSPDLGDLMTAEDWYQFDGTQCNFETGTWEHDSKEHWKKCVCGKESDTKETHIFNEDATCECGYKAVTSIDKICYGTLEEAVNNASDNATITILRDVELEDSLNITGQRNIVLDLKGKTIDGQIVVDGGSVTINDGVLTHDGLNYENSTLNIKSGKVTLGPDVNVQATANPNQSGTKFSTAIAVYGELEVNGSKITGNDWGIGLFESCKVTLNDATIHTGGNPISTNVGNSNPDMIVNINGGDYQCTAKTGNWKYCAIYWSSPGKLTIKGGTFVTKAKDTNGNLTSASLYLKNGDIHVIDGYFIDSQDGIKIEAGQANTKVNVVVGGGTFSGSRSGIYVKDGTNADANKNSSVVVNNGTFDGGDSSFFTSVKDAEFIKNVSLKDGLFKNNFYSWKSEESKEITSIVSGGTYYDKDVFKYLAENYAAEFTKHGGNDAYVVKSTSELKENAIAVIHYEDGTMAYVLDGNNLEGLDEKDYVDFRKLIDLVENKYQEQGNFTDGSWSAYQEALTKAVDILSNKESKTAAEVASAHTLLQERITNLKEKQAPVIDVKFTKGSTQFTYGEKISGTINIYKNAKTNELTYNQVKIFVGETALTEVLTAKDGQASFTIDSKKLTPNNDTDIELTIYYGGNGDLTKGSQTVSIRLKKADYNLEFKENFKLTKGFDGNGVGLVGDDILLDGQPVDFSKCTISWKDKNGTLGNPPKDAGQYELEVMLEGNEYFNDKTIVHEFEITPKSLTQDMFSIDSVTYTGKELKPKVKVPDIMAESDYTLVYSDNVNAGTGKVTVTGRNNFTGSVELEFTINKDKAPEVDVPTNLTGKYSQELSEIELSGEWKWINPNETLTTDKKEYEAYITVDDANYDYNGVDGYNDKTHQVVRSIPVTVSKAESLLTASLVDNKKDYVYGDVIELDVSLAVDKNRSIDTNKVAVFYNNQQISDEVELVEGSSARLSVDTTKVKEILKPSENMITLTVKYDGNNDLNAGSTSVDINLKKKATSLKFKDNVKFEQVYNGEIANLDSNSVDKVGSSKYVTLVWNTSDKKAPTNAETYTVYAQVEGDDYYTSAKTEEMTYVIKKAPTTIYLNKTSMVYNGTSVSLTNEDYVVSGSQGEVNISWLDAEGKQIEPPREVGTYTVVLTVKENTNYEGKEIKVPFTITSSKTNLVVSTDRESYTYGDDIKFTIKVNPTGQRINQSNVVSVELNGKEIVKDKINENEEKTLSVDTKSLENIGSLTFTIKYSGNLDMDEQVVTKNVQVNKANSSVDITSSLSKDYDGEAVSLEETGYKVSGSTGKVSVVYLDSNGKEINAPKDAGSYKVKVSVAADDFYKETSATKEFTISKVQNAWNQELSAQSIEYGQDLKVSAKAEFGKVNYLYSDSKDGKFTSTVPSDVGMYYVKAIVEDTENYSGLESQIVSFEIKKAEFPEEDKEEVIKDFDKELENLYPEGIQARVGQRLGDIKLPDGYAWKDPDMILTDERINEVSIICLLEDGNYQSFTFNIDITVNPAIEELNAVPTISAKDITLTVGDKFDPMNGVTASDKEDGDITKNIKVTLNEVDTSKAGVYLVTYEVTDSNGASYAKTITVTVKEKETTKPDTGKDEDKKDPEKSEGENTGLSTNAGLFAGLTGISALGIALMSIFKKRKR